jgi:hypothetical protein
MMIILLRKNDEKTKDMKLQVKVNPISEYDNPA